MFLTQNLAGQAVHHLVGGIKHAGCLRSGGEGGAAARDAHDLGLRARLLRFHCSETRFGPCAEKRMQECSSGREGDGGAPDAHGPSGEPPRWVWAGGGHRGGRRVGIRMRCM